MIKTVKGKLTLDEHEKILRFSKNGIADIIIKLEGATSQVVARERAGEAAKSWILAGADPALCASITRVAAHYARLWIRQCERFSGAGDSIVYRG